MFEKFGYLNFFQNFQFLFFQICFFTLLFYYFFRELEEKARIEAEEAKKIMLEKEKQQKEEQQRKTIAEAGSITSPVVQKTPEYSLSDMEAYIKKMTEYVNHMQMLEKRNQLLESENSRIQEVNFNTKFHSFDFQFQGKQSPSPRNGRSYKAWHHRSTDPEDLPELSVTVEVPPTYSQ